MTAWFLAAVGSAGFWMGLTWGFCSVSIVMSFLAIRYAQRVAHSRRRIVEEVIVDSMRTGAMRERLRIVQAIADEDLAFRARVGVFLMRPVELERAPDAPLQ